MSAPVVLVSGGNRGIGCEACRALAERGARVLLGSRRLAEGETAARSLSKAGSVTAVPLDVSDPKSVAALAARVAKDFGALDVLVNNAGVYSQAGVLDAADAEVESVLAANLVGAPRDPRDAGEAVAVAALEDARTGVFLRDGKVIPW